MSLLVTNLATDKQIALLARLEYVGTGKYAADKLSETEAAELISELFEQQRIQEKAELLNFGSLDEWMHTTEELEDPFNEINK
jgi:hypothetical protein